MSTFIYMALCIILNVCGHAFLKAGMNKIGSITPDKLLANLFQIVFTPFVLLGLLSYISSVALYMVVLSRAHLSYAYPLLMSVGYVLIVIISWQIFKEPFSTLKWIGIFLIFLGVFLIGK